MFFQFFFGMTPAKPQKSEKGLTSPLFFTCHCLKTKEFISKYTLAVFLNHFVSINFTVETCVIDIVVPTRGQQYD